MKFIRVNRKIGTFLGGLFILTGLVGYFYIDNNIRENSSELGDAVLVAKQDIPEGFIIKNREDLDNYFTVKKIAKSDEIASAVTVETTEQFSINSLVNSSKPKELYIDDNFIANLVNKKITVNILKNEQVSANWLSNDLTEYKNDDRIFNISVNFNTAVGGDINTGDYVDVWSSGNNNVTKILGPLKIIKIKNSDNIESSSQLRVIPATVIVKCSESQIVALKQIKTDEIFLTKYGIAPTKK